MANKYRRIIFTIIIIAVFASSFNNAAHASSENEAAADKHFLWAVEGKRNTVYLMGSMHVLTQNAYPLPRAIEDIYSCCDKLIFEVNSSEAETTETQSKHMTLGIYSGGQTLSDNISDDTYSALKLRFEAVDLHISQFERFKPWFIAQLIASLELQRLGHNPKFGIDRYFHDKATKDNKEVAFLESIDFLLSNMAKLSDKDQEMFLNGIMKELDIIYLFVDDMVNAWQNGNTEKLASIHEQSFKEYPHLYNRFITSRNNNWVSKIRNLLKHEDNILIIVNARHLVGKESVIDLLVQNGYKVSQMQSGDKQAHN